MISDLYRADFVRYLRKKQTPKQVQRILDGLLKVYSEWDASRGTGYSVINEPWDRQTDKKMTPQQKLALVLEHAGLPCIK